LTKLTFIIHGNRRR